MAKGTKCFRNDIIREQTVSLEQIAKEYGTTVASVRKFMLDYGILIHKMGNSRFIYTTDFQRYLVMSGIKYSEARDKGTDEIRQS